jgi:hypothetical protein
MLNPWCNVIFSTINIIVNNIIYDSVLFSVFTTAFSFVSSKVVRCVELQGTRSGGGGKKSLNSKLERPKPTHIWLRYDW